MVTTTYTVGTPLGLLRNFRTDAHEDQYRLEWNASKDTYTTFDAPHLEISTWPQPDWDDEQSVCRVNVFLSLFDLLYHAVDPGDVEIYSKHYNGDLQEWLTTEVLEDEQTVWEQHEQRMFVGKRVEWLEEDDRAPDASMLPTNLEDVGEPHAQFVEQFSEFLRQTVDAEPLKPFTITQTNPNGVAYTSLVPRTYPAPEDDTSETSAVDPVPNP